MTETRQTTSDSPRPWILTELTARGAGPLLLETPLVPATWWEAPPAAPAPHDFPRHR